MYSWDISAIHIIAPGMPMRALLPVPNHMGNDVLFVAFIVLYIVLFASLPVAAQVGVAHCLCVFHFPDVASS